MHGSCSPRSWHLCLHSANVEVLPPCWSLKRAPVGDGKGNGVGALVGVALGTGVGAAVVGPGVGDGVGAGVGGQSSEPGLFVNMLSVFTLSEMSQHRYWSNADAP